MCAVHLFDCRQVDVIATALHNGWERGDGDDEADAVSWIIAHVREGNTAYLVNAKPFLLHLSRTPGKPTVLAEMKRPSSVKLTRLAFENNVSREFHHRHWLFSKIEWRGESRRVFSALPFLIQGNILMRSC